MAKELRKSRGEELFAVAVREVFDAVAELRTDQSTEWTEELKESLMEFADIIAEPTDLPPEREFDFEINLETGFQTMMNRVLSPYLGKFCVVYLDDVLIYSKTAEEHLEHIRLVLRELQRHHLHIKLSKCSFGSTSVEFLGHIVEAGQIKMDPRKVEAVQQWPVPKTVKDVRGFLGLAGYYRKFIHNFAAIAAPLHDLTKNQPEFVWTPRADAAFRALKDAMLVDYNPVFKRQYHLAHREQEWANDWVKKLEKAGIVGEIESPYAAPVIVAPKKDEHGAWTDLRYAVDYRGLNERTIRDQYPCPTADELMTRMEGASRFTATDCTKAFHQRRVWDKPSGPDGLSAQQRLAFHAGNRLLTFKRMPFGHKNCVAAWQRVVDQALAGLDFAVAFADDVLIFSHDDEQEHMRRVRIVFDRLKARGVQVKAINSLPAPKNVSDVRHFLGMATYYCRFLESFSLVKAPLTALTKKDEPWKWGAAEQQSFDAIKAMLVSAPVLRHPDWRRPFVMHTDWSRAGVGACLSQVDDNGVEYAVSFASRMNTPVEADLSSYEGEVGAVVWAVQRFRYYLYGNHFQLITNRKAMEWLRTTARLRGKLARWSLMLAEYDFSIKHRPGKDNTVPDLLSRRPMPAEPVRATSDADGTATAIATQRRSPAAMADASAMFGGCSPSKCLGRTPALPSAHAAFATQCIAMAFTAGVYASQELHWPTRDVWSSPVAISYLRGETMPADVSVEVWQQLVRRCAKYSWHNEKEWLHTRDTAREVPKPEERPDAIRRVHASIGHLGRHRTFQVLARHFVGPGMHKDVGAWSSSAARACDRVKASFNQNHDRLKPMPLFGLFYRFSVDSAGPLPTSSEGHKYVIVIVEHFSKWIELVSVRDLEASTTAKAFHERVLARYGAPVEVVTDNGTEYQGAFREQLERHGIQPVNIPPGHPQANGMAERIVQVLKVALRKVVPTLGTASWHSWMPVIEFGYPVSKQATTGYSPYFLLFGCHHVAQDQVRALLEEPVDMDNDIAVINLITQRADMLRAAMPKAFERALQAQQRDVVRYRKVRRGDVQPRRHRFEIGSYVYVAQPPLSTLDVRTARTILRVVEILKSGWLRLSGSDGNEIQVHMDNCAPCHLSNLVPARYGRGMPACKVPVLRWRLRPHLPAASPLCTHVNHGMESDDPEVAAMHLAYAETFDPSVYLRCVPRDGCPRSGHHVFHGAQAAARAATCEFCSPPPPTAPPPGVALPASAAGVRALQRQHAPAATSAAHDAALAATARWCATSDVYRKMPRTPLRGTAVGVCPVARLVLFPLLDRTLAYADRFPPTDDRSYGAEGAVCVFAGLLLRPYPSSSPAVVRKLAERRVRLWEAGDVVRAGFSVCGMQQLWRESRDGNELHNYQMEAGELPTTTSRSARRRKRRRSARARAAAAEAAEGGADAAADGVPPAVVDAHRRAAKLTAVQELRRARQALDTADLGMVSDAAAALTALDALHPPPATTGPEYSPPEEPPDLQRAPPSWGDNADEVMRWGEDQRRVLRRAPRLSAGHVDWWRWEHIRDLDVPSWRLWVNRCPAGRCHSRTAAFLASGSVFALHKDDPAAREEREKSGEPLRVRPLGVGSVLVRLASAHALGQVGADAREVMGPVQRSFQSGAGCETAYMSMRVALQLFGGRGTGGKGLLLLDIRNAFNESFADDCGAATAAAHVPRVFDEYCTELSKVGLDGAVYLGAPISHYPEWMTGALGRRQEAHATLLERIASFGTSGYGCHHGAMRLLVVCAVRQTGFLSRMMPPPELDPFLAAVDAANISAAFSLLGLDACDQSTPRMEAAIVQMSTPADFGGLNLALLQSEALRRFIPRNRLSCQSCWYYDPYGYEH
eukprot:jgi/Tetstr1/427309/TSEL_017478.t1